MSEQETLRAARIYLACVAEPPAPALFRLVAKAGPVEAAELVRTGDVPNDVAEETCARRDVVVLRDRDFGDPHCGMRLVIPEDDDWPTRQLRSLTNPSSTDNEPMIEPLALWVRGTVPLPELLEQSVTITGSRAASAYGQHIATELGYALAQHQITTISGAAYGVDSAALRGALAAGGSTVAVVACGVDVPYPSAHASLLDRIARHGAILSEYRPGTTPAQHRFVARNRIITAFSTMLVIPEAGRRSGALAAAHAATRLGREVRAVPGPITSATSLGANQLLRDRIAIAVTTVQDVVDAVHDAHRSTTAAELVDSADTGNQPTAQ